MSGANTENDGESEIVTVNFKLTESFLEKIDDTWQGRGFNSRSEFIRYTLRDAVEFPTFDRDELVALFAAEADVREGTTLSRAEAREAFGTDDGWTWELAVKAWADLEGFSPDEQDRLPAKLDEIVDSPWRDPPEYGEPLRNSPHKKIRIGEFRLSVTELAATRRRSNQAA